MVARGSSDWDDGPGIASQSRALRSRLTALGEEDATAFAQVLVTMRDRTGTPEQRDFALGLALLRAAEVPLRIAEAAADVAELAAAAAAEGSPHLQPDATAAAALAEAATQAATPSRRDQSRDRPRRPALGAGRVACVRSGCGEGARAGSDDERPDDPGLEPHRRGGRARSASRPSGPIGSRGTGRSEERPARASTSASSTAASTATIRSSAGSRARSR